MAFVDEARIKVMAGRGGHGAASFRREPYVPKGGPDGGDGGDGGSVVLQADGSVGTLLDVKQHPHVRAERGGHGQGNRKHGAAGQDRIVKVPVGTVVLSDEGVVVADLAAAGQRVIAARGGRGGRGNARFATATRRSPSFAENGEPGEERWLRLELRLLADVGLVGLPNAGKSTLIARISAARPKIADYPFTTLEPNLGVVSVADRSFVVADIPGLVPGAAEGKGLGHRFLRHVRRAAVLVFLVDLAAFDRDPLEDVVVLRAELERFDRELAARPSIVVGNKIDAAAERVHDLLERYPEAVPISAVTGHGIDVLLRRLDEEVSRARAETPEAVGFVRHVVEPDRITIHPEGESWRVRGRRPERAVSITNMDNEEAVARLQRSLIAMGVEAALGEAGAVAGDEVRIGDVAFEFQPEREDVQ